MTIQILFNLNSSRFLIKSNKISPLLFPFPSPLSPLKAVPQSSTHPLLITIRNTIIKSRVPSVMNRLNLRLQDLRQSQRFLSKQQMNMRRLKFCCCNDEQTRGEQLNAPIFSMSPQPKISIKRMNKRSPNAWNHSNSQFSLSKLSQRSILPSKKASQSNGISHSGNISDHNRPHCHSQSTNIKFIYSNRSHYNRGSYYIKPTVSSQPLIPAPTLQPVKNETKQHYKIPVKGREIDENMQRQFMNILAFGQNIKEEQDCGDPFPLNNPELPKVKAAFHSMPNFSFGQNQKQEFMSKYLNIKHETSHEIVLSSKENSKKSQMMKEIREEKLSKYSRSSKSSGQVFVRGTFNKTNLNIAKKRDMLFEYRSEEELSLESSQSLVLESYQGIMKKRGSLNRDYQY